MDNMWTLFNPHLGYFGISSILISCLAEFAIPVAKRSRKMKMEDKMYETPKEDAEGQV